MAKHGHSLLGIVDLFRTRNSLRSPCLVVLFFFFKSSIVDLCVVLVSGVQHSDLFLFFRLHPIIDYCKILNVISCVIE